MTKKVKDIKPKKDKIDEQDVKQEKMENKSIRHLYIYSLLVLAFLGVNGYLFFTEPSAVKQMYEYNSKVEIERVKLAEYKETINPEDQTKYDEENHELDTTLKEQKEETKKLEKTVEIAKKAQEELEKKVKDLTAVKETNDINKYLEALNSNHYRAQTIYDRGRQRELFEKSAEQGGSERAN